MVNTKERSVGEWGRCKVFDRPVMDLELCDSWSARGVLVWAKGKKT